MHRRVRLIGPLFLAVILLAWAVTAYVRSARDRDGAVRGSGTIETEQVVIASKVPGRIARLHAREGDRVRRGMPLVTIEGRELLAQIDQARAGVETARARVAQAEAALALQRRQVEAQIAQAEAALAGARSRLRQASEGRDLAAAQTALQVRQAEAAFAAAAENSRAAQATLDRAAQELRRLEALHGEGAASRQQLETAQAVYEVARAQYVAARETAAQAEAALRLARDNLRLVRLREEEVSAARSQVAQAEAALRQLETQRENLVVTAPIDGTVLSRHAGEGEIVAAGAPILTLAELHEVWVRLYIPLPQLGAITLGQRADVTTDALPGRTFAGRVTEIAQQAEFTPSNVQTREERVKLVFAVKVALANPDGVLKPGMPVDAAIITR